MLIMYGDYLSKIKSIVEERCKYQKVMVLIDENISNIETNEVYNEIKELCIYNLQNIKNFSEEELNDGYRMVLYFMSVESYVKLKFDNSEFINVFIPQDQNLLPYFLNYKNRVTKESNYLIFKNNFIDKKMISSIYFNNFYNYFKNLIEFQPVNTYSENILKDFNNSALINNIKILPDDYLFKDVELIKNIDLDYEDIQMVQLIVVKAILVLIKKVNYSRHTLVDAYKIAKNDIDMIDRIYAKATDDGFIELIKLNSNYLVNFGEETKKNIIELIDSNNIDFFKVEELIKKIKNYVKNDCEILFYLFLFEIF